MKIYDYVMAPTELKQWDNDDHNSKGKSMRDVIRANALEQAVKRDAEKVRIVDLNNEIVETLKVGQAA